MRDGISHLDIRRNSDVVVVKRSLCRPSSYNHPLARHDREMCRCNVAVIDIDTQIPHYETVAPDISQKETDPGFIFAAERSNNFRQAQPRPLNLRGRISLHLDSTGGSLDIAGGRVFLGYAALRTANELDGRLRLDTDQGDGHTAAEAIELRHPFFDHVLLRRG